MNSIPSDIYSVIASFLDDRSRRLMRLASVQWFNIIRYNNFTFNFTTNEQIPQILNRIQKYNFPITVSFAKSKCVLTQQQVKTMAELTQITQLRISSVIERKTDESLAPLTNLKQLTELDVNPGPTVLSHFINLKQLKCESIDGLQRLDLSRFSQLESFEANLDDVIDESVFSMIPAQHLTKLETCSGQLEQEHNLARFSKLKSLRIFIDYLSGYYSERDFTMPALPNLESLNFNLSTLNGMENLTKLTSLVISSSQCSLSQLAALHRLKYLYFFLPPTETHPQALQVFTRLTNLETLKFYGRAMQPIETSQLLHSEKLTELALYGGIKIDESLSKFGNLQTLTLQSCNEQPITAGILLSLTNLTKLQIFPLANADLLSAIESLTKLKVLQLTSESKLGRQHILHIENLTALEDFMFTGIMYKNAHIDDSKIRHLHLTQLKIGWLVNDTVLENICAMTTLESLQFDNTHLLTDQSVLILSKLPNLTSLTLNEARDSLTGVTLTLLTSLQHLATAHTSGSLTVDTQTLKDKLSRLYKVYNSFKRN